MKWSYILFLPALVSLLWAGCTLLFKRRLTAAQVLLSIMLVMLAAAMVMLGVYFRGHSGVLFLYDYIFEVLTTLSIAIFYLGVCALTEPRGVKMNQRMVMLVPLFFIAGLTAGAYSLGWRGYDQLCHNIVNGDVAYIAGDIDYNFMLFWDHWFFPAFMLVYGAVLLFVGTRKVWVYKQRFNSYYAENLHERPIDCRMLVIFAWMFLPLGVLTFWAIDFRPYYYKYWLIVLSLAMAVMQWLFGRFIYRLDHDAVFLADYIREHSGMDGK